MLDLESGGTFDEPAGHVVIDDVVVHDQRPGRFIGSGEVRRNFFF